MQLKRESLKKLKKSLDNVDDLQYNSTVPQLRDVYLVN